MGRSGGDRAESASEDHDIADVYRAPATLVEQILAGIYANVLEVDRVGLDEHRSSN